MTIGVGSVTVFDDPLQRIRAGQIAQVPILLGSLEDDGKVFAYFEQKNLSATIALLIGSSGVQGDLSPSVVRELYPGLNDSQVIADMWRDVKFRWCVPYSVCVETNTKSNKYVLKSPAKLWSDAFVLSGIKDVHRYTYGKPCDTCFPL